ncbi:transcription termination factor 3, mitochondrial [Apis dorsata]|uniref:transcription termination factor 3, mitochondrial n=1 Tax=Apis dorsata TaxID=7462 RepID=UPI001293C62D|nr:transcription termination factor 3, mitochondrial [Apis dorsata]
MISRMCIFLYSKHCNVSKISNFIFRNVSKTSKLFNCSTVDIVKNKISNIDIKKRNDNINNMDSEKINATVTTMENNKNIENNNTKINNELEQSHNIKFLNTNDYNLNDSLEDINEKLPGPFDHCNEDLSHIEPYITPTYNFAKFADQSNTIQQLVKLGVELYKIERDKEVLEMFLSLDFDKNIKPYIQFLHDCGVTPENLGYFITRNPKIFKEDIDDLCTRIRYLRYHNFSVKMIERIVNKHPPWLSFKAQEIDKRLGYFQHAFKLNGHQIRILSVKCPKLITYDMKRIKKSTFAVKEEMGFNIYETKDILLKAPRVWIRAKTEIVKTFDYLHNEMGLSHTFICTEPKILICRKSRLERRHKVLVELKRNQYDPTKPLYVSLFDLISGTDIDFCEKIAKIPIKIYNDFLKSF